MTTVVGDYRVKKIVSDSKVSDDDMAWTGPKIYEIKGNLYAFAGSVVEEEKALKYLRNGGRRPKLSEDFDAIMLTHDGLFRLESTLIPVPVHCGYFAIGSGRLAAMAMMNNGATAEEAVKAAMTVDPHSGGDLQTMILKGK